jgi:group I intron endonuclease
MKNIIYKIEIEGYEKIYIGSAIDFNKRKAHHISQLRSNKHRNQNLQRIYNKYGENSFHFSILEQIEDQNALLEAEQKWIDSFEFTKLINICPKAGNTLGRIHTETS